MTEELLELHAIVRGRVQGVGFRATTQYYASQAKLKGQVKNLKDGSVEIIAQGTHLQLENLVNHLKKHFSVGQITNFVTEYSAPSHTYSSFSIE